MIIKIKQEEILPYLEDTSNFKDGFAEKVFIPQDEKEVFDVIDYAVKNKLPLTISAAGTGTVAGRIPKEGIVISTEKLNKIIDIDTKNKTAVLQSGVVVYNFLNEIKKFSLFYPPFPTEKGAFIGGNVATNASGEYSFRFGPTRKYVKRIKMILTTGEILEVKRGEVFEKDGILDYGKFKINLPSYRTPEVKCSAGYYVKDGMDAIDLLIGSEGTLGVITEVEVFLIDELPERFIMLMFFDEEKETEIPKIVSELKTRKENLSIYCLEFFDKNSLIFIKDEYDFIPKDTIALYIESEKEKIDNWLEVIEKFGCKETVLSNSKKEYELLSNLRYKLPETINSYFKKINSIKVSVDAAVPEGKLNELFNFYKNIMFENQNINMVIFGHIGENHLHFNMFPKNNEEKIVCEKIYIDCIKKAVSLGGTGFAEHGIGKLKNKYLEVMYKKEAILEMAKIKKSFDPYCILNLDNIIKKEYLFL